MKRHLVVVACLAACGCEDPIVGGECLVGYHEVAGSCVRAIGAGDAGGAGSGGAGSGGAGQGVSSGGSSGGPQDAASGSSSSGSEASGGACGDGETDCGGACVDLSSDPFHCGACAVVCASGICVDGRCEDAFAGHVVLCGFEAGGLAGVAPSRIAGNAVFAWPMNPVRVGILVEEDQPSTAVFQDVVTREAAARGRTASLEAMTDGATLEERLGASSLDVAVIGAIPRGDDGAQLGLRLAEGFSALAARGGVIVVLAPTSAPPMASFMASAGLASDVETVAAAASPLNLVAFDDTLAAGVPSAFARPPGTLAFTGPDLGGRVVVADGAGRAVVVHGVVEP